MKIVFLVEKKPYEKAKDFLYEYTKAMQVLDEVENRIKHEYVVRIKGTEYVYLYFGSDKKVKQFRYWLEQYNVPVILMEV